MEVLHLTSFTIISATTTQKSPPPLIIVILYQNMSPLEFIFTTKIFNIVLLSNLTKGVLRVHAIFKQTPQLFIHD